MFFKYIRVFFYCYEDIKGASFYEEQFTPYKNQGKGGGGDFQANSYSFNRYSKKFEKKLHEKRRKNSKE